MYDITILNHYNIILRGEGGKWAVSVVSDVCRILPKTEISFPHEPHIPSIFCHASVFFGQCLVVRPHSPALSKISTLTPSTIWDIHFTTRHYGDSHFTTSWSEKGWFPTLQPSSKTKLSGQARQQQYYKSNFSKICHYDKFINVTFENYNYIVQHIKAVMNP